MTTNFSSTTTKEDDDSDAGQSDDSGDGIDEDDNGRTLKNLVDGLDPRLRQKVMMGRKKGSEPNDEDRWKFISVPFKFGYTIDHNDFKLNNSDEDSDVEKDGWGKKKTYWSGDTADLEIGQDVQDAEDEEEAAEVS